MTDRIDPPAQTDLFGKIDGVDRIEGNLILCDIPLHLGRQTHFEILGTPIGVQQESAARLQALQHVVFFYVSMVVASHEVSLFDQIRFMDRLLAEAQIGNGDAARFFRIVGKIGLDMHIGMIPDDFDRIFVGPDSPVGTESPELRLESAFLTNVDLFIDRKRQVGDVIIDADREGMLRLLFL